MNPSPSTSIPIPLRGIQRLSARMDAFMIRAGTAIHRKVLTVVVPILIMNIVHRTWKVGELPFLRGCLGWILYWAALNSYSYFKPLVNRAFSPGIYRSMVSVLIPTVAISPLVWIWTAVAVSPASIGGAWLIFLLSLDVHFRLKRTLAMDSLWADPRRAQAGFSNS